MRSRDPDDDLTESERGELEDLAEQDDFMGEIARAWLDLKDGE